ncbi:MAG TPA: rRNA maturation RNase YbeY [Candidatus Scatomorpha merdigallinarum]|nr:rRNA maturation RNase YbeY [Candidatus Scatomorpha merdigallinarum]
MDLKLSLSREKRGLGHENARALILRAARAALACEGVDEPCLLGALLTDNEGIRELNREYRNIDSATDVLSFPMNELTPGEFDAEECERDMDTGRIVLGDMAFSLERCAAQGEEFGHGFDHELMYLTVHSVLHLLGYDHVDEGEMKKQMRAREKEIMAALERA